MGTEMRAQGFYLQKRLPRRLDGRTDRQADGQTDTQMYNSISNFGYFVDVEMLCRRYKRDETLKEHQEQVFTNAVGIEYSDRKSFLFFITTV